jgi:hypothetical protein
MTARSHLEALDEFARNEHEQRERERRRLKHERRRRKLSKKPKTANQRRATGKRGGL